MKLRPALFMPEMIRSIYKQWKTMTRRLNGLDKINEDPDNYSYDGLCLQDDIKGRWRFKLYNKKEDNIETISCPYGKPGDVLWARESGWVHNNYMRGLNDPCLYWKADYELYDEAERAVIKQNCGFFPNIHMYFEFTRVFLKITDIKLERIRDISEADAIAEGIYRWKDADAYFDYVRRLRPDTNNRYLKEGIKTILLREQPIREKMEGHALYKEYITPIFVPDELSVINNAKESFFGLFLSVNKPQKSMDLNSPLNNPWIWAIRFEVLSTTGNPDPDVYQIAAQLPKKAKKYSAKHAKNIPGHAAQ